MLQTPFWFDNDAHATEPMRRLELEAPIRGTLVLPTPASLQEVELTLPFVEALFFPQVQITGSIRLHNMRALSRLQLSGLPKRPWLYAQLCQDIRAAPSLRTFGLAHVSADLELSPLFESLPFVTRLCLMLSPDAIYGSDSPLHTALLQLPAQLETLVICTPNSYDRVYWTPHQCQFIPHAIARGIAVDLTAINPKGQHIKACLNTLRANPLLLVDDHRFEFSGDENQPDDFWQGMNEDESAASRWSCEACTFENRHGVDLCEMCGTPMMM